MMRNKRKILISGRRLILLVVLVLVSGHFSGIMAQVLPPRPIVVTVSPLQSLSFGAFAHGPLGGSVTISPGESRSSTGDILLLNLTYPFSAALFDIKANPGTVISIMNGPDINLSGSGGGTLLLHIGSSLPASPFVTTVPLSSLTQVRIGGTITVGATNPPGTYSGSYSVTFIQE